MTLDHDDDRNPRDDDPLDSGESFFPLPFEDDFGGPPEKPKRVTRPIPSQSSGDDDAGNVGGIPVPGGASGVPEIQYLGTEMPAGRQRGPGGCGVRRWWPLYAVLGCLATPVLCSVLLCCGLAIAGSSLAAYISDKQVSAETRQEFQVPPLDELTLIVDNPVGDVVLRPDPDGQSGRVVVVSDKRAFGFDDERARANLDGIQVQATQQSEDTLRLSVQVDRPEDSFFSFADEVDLQIFVPAGQTINLQVTVDNGEIDVLDLRTGTLDLRTANGGIDFDGPISARTDRQPLSMRTNNGSIDLRLPASTALTIDAQVDNGDIDVDGDLLVRTPETDTRSGAGRTFYGVLGDPLEPVPTLQLRVDNGRIEISPN